MRFTPTSVGPVKMPILRGEQTTIARTARSTSVIIAKTTTEDFDLLRIIGLYPEARYQRFLLYADDLALLSTVAVIENRRSSISVRITKILFVTFAKAQNITNAKYLAYRIKAQPIPSQRSAQ